MKKEIFKIKNTDWWQLSFFICLLIIYIACIGIAWYDWSSLQNKEYGMIIILLVGLYFANYIIYALTNNIEIDYDNLELKEKVLGFTLYAIKIKEIQKMYHEFPYVGVWMFGAESLLMPNLKENSSVEFLINNKFIRKNWYLGKNNVNKIIRVLIDTNSDIKIAEKSFNPSFSEKREINFSDFKKVILVAIPIILVLLFALNYLQKQ